MGTFSFPFCDWCPRGTVAVSSRSDDGVILILLSDTDITKSACSRRRRVRWRLLDAYDKSIRPLTHVCYR
eukprot:1740414-Pyramimonas_sp.AAC.1